MDWKDYEQITKYIHEVLGKKVGVEIECYGRSCKVKGKSGISHQIDVLTKHSDGLYTYKTAIECKYWNENINKDIIMKVAEIVEDAKLDKGIIVSKLGFTKDAVNYAKYKNIGLVELREMTEKDWEGRIKDIVINTNILLPEINDLKLIFAKGSQPNIPEGKIRTDLLEIHKDNGEIEKFEKYVFEKYVKDFKKELTTKNENEKFSKIYKLNDNEHLVYTLTNKVIPIQGFEFTGVLKIEKLRTEIKGQEYIWLIMRIIFEGKTFTISKNKEIRERK